jgi:predicted nucleic-acid-binding protein
VTGLDTNVLVRYLTQDHPAQSAAAASEIEQAARSGAKLVISPILLCELVWVLESAYGRSRGEVAGALDRVLRTAQFDVLEKDLLWPALEEYRRGPGDFADYYLGRRHHQAGAKKTLTFDRQLKNSPHFHLLST